ncbi:hypothetical protein TNCV_2932471 [Trichonephila clavipes]|nr:hypothetical protein TNCV_2932471 [Trichonephila clavipes]
MFAFAAWEHSKYQLSLKSSWEVDGSGEEEGVPDPLPQGEPFQNSDGSEPNHTVTCMVLKVADKERHTN